MDRDTENYIERDTDRDTDKDIAWTGIQTKQYTDINQKMDTDRDTGR
jgi:hypothetical protein